MREIRVAFREWSTTGPYHHPDAESPKRIPGTFLRFSLHRSSADTECLSIDCIIQCLGGVGVASFPGPSFSFNWMVKNWASHPQLKTSQQKLPPVHLYYLS